MDLFKELKKRVGDISAEDVVAADKARDEYIGDPDGLPEFERRMVLLLRVLAEHEPGQAIIMMAEQIQHMQIELHTCRENIRKLTALLGDE